MEGTLDGIQVLVAWYDRDTGHCFDETRLALWDLWQAVRWLDYRDTHTNLDWCRVFLIYPNGKQKEVVLEDYEKYK